MLFAWVAVGTDAEPGPEAEGHAPPRNYRHPLQNALLDDGRIALFDVLNAPDGRRYSIGDTVWEDEDGVLHVESGIELLERRPFTPEEKARAEAKRAQRAAAMPAPKIGYSLAKAMAKQEGGATPIPVSLSLAEDEGPSLYNKVERAIALGRVQTTADLLAVRREKLAERQARIAEAQAPVIEQIENMGGVVTGVCKNMYCLSADLSPDHIALLEGDERVRRMDAIDRKPIQDTAYGTEVSNATQTDQLVEDSYDGELASGSSDDLYVAHIETGGVNNEHVAFNDTSLNDSRIQLMFLCNAGMCWQTSNYLTSQESSHATAVAGLAIADLMDGQDPNITPSNLRRNRSGFAREARLIAYNTIPQPDSASVIQAFSTLLTQAGTYPIHVANLSESYQANDPTCSGATSLSRSANSLFENGILLFKSAGNLNHDSTIDCTVTSPGSAIGVFTVGAYGNDPFGTIEDFRTDPIFRTGTGPQNGTSRGGTISEGDNRTIVDIAGFSSRRYTISCCDASSNQAYDVNSLTGGTSFATPTVAGAAIDFIDWYKSTLSDFIDNPGILFSQMLIMGDRQGQSGYMSSEFDNLWGAGRMKMRRWDGDGMDSPWGAKIHYTCISNGEEYEVPINNNQTLSTSVDVVKAVAYWYDKFHEYGYTLPNVDLELRRADTDVPLVISNHTTDNKERVFYDDPGGKPLKLVIVGEDIDQREYDWVCGTGAVRVYYSYFYEDSARNDADGPAWDGSDIGVEPED